MNVQVSELLRHSSIIQNPPQDAKQKRCAKLATALFLNLFTSNERTTFRSDVRNNHLGQPRE